MTDNATTDDTKTTATVNDVLNNVLNTKSDLIDYVGNTALHARVPMDDEFFALVTDAITAFKDSRAESNAQKLADSINDNVLIITPEWESTTYSKEHILTWAMNVGLVDQHEIENTDAYKDAYGNTPYEAIKDYIMDHVVREFATWE